MLIPINLVLFPLMSDVRYEIKTPLPDFRLENNDFEKSGSIRTQRTTHKLILVDLVDVDKVRVHRSGFTQLTMRDLKKWKNINTHPIYIIIDHHFTLAGLVIDLFKYFNVITDYLPFID